MKKLVTHDGVFHADEVFASAAFLILFPDAEITRSRNNEIINSADIVYDVGHEYDPSKMRFDHHQGNFAEKRENGIPYSSFGLIWKSFGSEICESSEVADKIDEKLVQLIDATDNGFKIFESDIEDIDFFDMDTIARYFRPTWQESYEKMDEDFFELVDFAKSLLQKMIKSEKAKIIAKEIILKLYEEAEDKRIIVLDDFMPANSVLKDLPEPLFYVYRTEPENNWSIKAVQEDLGVNRKDLPADWAGLSGDELVKVSGIEDAVFCHKTLFMAVAKTKEGIMKMAQKALEN